jgi:Xaa-Pro aminopeptidase
VSVPFSGLINRELAERVSKRYQKSSMLEGRRRAQAAVRDIARRIAPGMTEEAGLDLTRRTLRAHGFERDWAAPDLRFGTNTLKRYGEPSEPGVVLARDDVWFVDVGPLWQDHECDYAETFAVGHDPQRLRLVRDVREIFERTSRHWREARATGVQLYRFAAADAQSRGWRLDLEMAGHRVGDHPHVAFHDGLLSQADFTPSGGLWMLEIQIRSPDRPYGAFFEDLLLDESDD